MPTGYTAAIIENDISFEQFALSCARAFGALIMMRDEPMDADIPETLPTSSYRQTALAADQAKLMTLGTMEPHERIQYGEDKNVEEIKYNNQGIANAAQERQKLLEMLGKVKAWEAPTPDHQGLKDFMVQQITVSLPNMDDWYWMRLFEAQRADPLDVWISEVISLGEQIERHKRGQNEDDERDSGRNQWLRDLRASLAN